LFTELYKNGIQRTSFLSTIDLLKQRCAVHSLDSGIDYRMMERNQRQVYFSPLGPGADAKINRIWNEITEGKEG
jgi:predicted ATPase